MGVLVLVLGAPAAAAAAGLETLEFALGQAAGTGWRVGGALLRLDLGAGDATLDVSALELAGMPGPPLALRARCALALTSAEGFECSQGTVSVGQGGQASQGSVAASGPVAIVARGDRLSVDAGPLALGAGTLAVRVEKSGPRWRADIALDRTPTTVLGPLLALVAGAEPAGSGTLDGFVRLAGDAAGAEVEADVRVDALAFSDALGQRAGEALAARVQVRGRLGASGWRGEVSATADAGALFVAPVFVDLAAHPIEVSAAGDWSPDRGAVALDRLALSQAGIGTVRGSLSADLGTGLRTAALDLAAPDLGRAFSVYALPVLAGTTAGGLSLQGRVRGRLDWPQAGQRTLSVELAQVEAELPTAGLAVFGVDASIEWADRAQVAPSTVRWAGAQVYGIDLGGAEARARLVGPELTLLDPLELTVLDGRLGIGALRANAPWGADPSVELSASLNGLSLGLLANTLAWPPFDGTIDGRIPAARYAQGVLEVDGAIEVDVFSGRVAIDGLRIERPLGQIPVLEADAIIEGVSLHALTRAFAFGNIEGTLDGRIQGLRLENWSPTAFDATLATPDNDPVRHRISQRAVDNLASLGGAGSVLSGTFLRIFSEFSYDRLGLSCRLQRGVCQMGGVTDAPSGYHIVVGGGLPPRIDVIGYNDAVDWSTLVERLRTITSGAAPVVR